MTGVEWDMAWSPLAVFVCSAFGPIKTHSKSSARVVDQRTYFSLSFGYNFKSMILL
jgi:hypothetical protein